jgi:hypothetical protein
VQAKVFIPGVTYYQFALIVEEEILLQDTFSLDGERVRLSTRRTFTPAETAHRLEVGVGGDFVQPITLDCRALSNDRLLVTATCTNDTYRPAYDRLLDQIRFYWGLEAREGPGEREVAEKAPATPRPINLSTAQRVAEAKYSILAHGLTKTAACDLANVHRHTYNRWENDPTVDRLLEEMRDHPPEL